MRRKPQKKVNISTLIIVTMTIVFMAIISCLAYKIYCDTQYEKRLKSFMRDEYTIYKSHFRDLPYDVFVQTKISCKRHGVAVPEMLALIKNESNFKRYAVSRCGAMGYTQLMPDKIVTYKMTDPFDTRQNIDVGVRFYKYCKMRAGGNTRLAYMKYNGGPSRIKFAKGGESEIYGERCINDLRYARGIVIARL
jgi:hypothetical protein